MYKAAALHNSWDCAMWCPKSIMITEWKKSKLHVSVHLELKCAQTKVIRWGMLPILFKALLPLLSRFSRV